MKRQNRKMKIVAGLGSIDEYIPYFQAGADEFFCGYVPCSWTEKYGTVLPLNRREVLAYNVQLGSFSELEILAEMVRKYRKPVHIAMNSLYYIPEQYEEIAQIILKCIKLGFDTFILADPALILYLQQKKIPCRVHLSGEAGEMNTKAVEVFQKQNQNLKRVIFHRKNTVEQMGKIIENICENESKIQNGSSFEQGSDELEFEAFALNELCQFTGAFCNSLHCDEMGYLCRTPYWGDSMMEERMETAGINCAETECTGDETGKTEESDGYLCGKSGCGLCELPFLEEAGITHLKLVGRGNYVEDMLRDIRNLKCALNVLEQVKKEYESRPEAEKKLRKQRKQETYIRRMKEEIFQGKLCSGNCIYRKKYYYV